MTDEDAIHARLDKCPWDGAARLVIADLLDEQARDVECPKCGGRGQYDCTDFACHEPRHPCPTCRGAGTVSDGRRERAAGYRWLAVAGATPRYFPAGWPMGFHPQDGPAPGRWEWWHEKFEGRAIDRDLHGHTLPGVVLAALTSPWSYGFDGGQVSVDYLTRRDADEDAALQYGRLPAETQARILAGVTA